MRRQGGDYIRDRLALIRRDCQERNWNSYNAAPVSDAALEAVTLICDSFDVVPTAKGGIEIHAASECVSLGINSSGRVGEVYVDAEGLRRWLQEIGMVFPDA